MKQTQIRAPDLRQDVFSFDEMRLNIPRVKARTEEYLKSETVSEERKVSVKCQTFDRLERLVEIAKKSYTKKQYDVIFELAFGAVE